MVLSSALKLLVPTHLVDCQKKTIQKTISSLIRKITDLAITEGYFPSKVATFSHRRLDKASYKIEKNAYDIITKSKIQGGIVSKVGTQFILLMTSTKYCKT